MKKPEVETTTDSATIDLLYSLENPPKGVKTSMSHEGYTEIDFQRTISFGRNGARGIFVLVLSTFGYGLFKDFFETKQAGDTELLPVVIAYFLITSIVLSAGFILLHILLHKKYYLYTDKLEVVSKLLFFKRKKTIYRNPIQNLHLEKYDNQSDSGWDLEATIDSDRKITLVSQQPFRITNWLGKVLSTWSEVKLTKWP